MVGTFKNKYRSTWLPNGEEGLTVGYSQDHYRCIQVYFPKTSGVRYCDTIMFFSTTISFPKVNLDNFLRQTATDIVIIFTAPPSSTTPSLQTGNMTRNVLLEVTTILNRADKVPVTQFITTEPHRVHKSTKKTKKQLVQQWGLSELRG